MKNTPPDPAMTVFTQQKGVALYVQLANVLRLRIRAKDWQKGDSLPPIPQLAREYTLGIVTVRQALALLSEEGLVASSRGKGTFVTGEITRADADASLKNAISHPLDSGPDLKIKVISRKNVHTLPKGLLIEGTMYEKYKHIKTVHPHKDTAIGVMDIYVQADTYQRIPKGADVKHKIGYLISRYGKVKTTAIRQEITVEPAGLEIAQLLSTQPNGYSYSDAVVRVRRCWIDESNRPIYAGIYRYRADKFVMDITQDIEDSIQTIPTLR